MLDSQARSPTQRAKAMKAAPQGQVDHRRWRLNVRNMLTHKSPSVALPACACVGKYLRTVESELPPKRKQPVNWKDISEEIKASSLSATESLLSRYDREGIYALALFTSDDGAFVSMAANTEKGYLARLAAEAEDEPNSPDDEVYYRWASSEWIVEGWDRPAFSRLNALLAQQDRSDFDSYFGNLIEAMAAALAAVKEALGERLADITAFVTVTDSDAAEEFENASASRINTPDLADRFLRRFG